MPLEYLGYILEILVATDINKEPSQPRQQMNLA
jgi:hypothetical protein